MNAFEVIVGQYLEAKGYWVRHSVKLEISAEEKREIGTPTTPRPEIDLVALCVEKNELMLIEAKSMLDAQVGLDIQTFTDDKARYKNRYKLFTKLEFREVVTGWFKKEYLVQGLINDDTKIRYGLAVGKIRKRDKKKIEEHFSRNGWVLFMRQDIKNTLSELSEKSWEDDVVTMTAKLLLRDE
jgi:hypothetical protein